MERSKRKVETNAVRRFASWAKNLLKLRLDADITQYRGDPGCEQDIADEIERQFRSLGEVLAFWLTHPIDALLNRARLNLQMLCGYADSRAEACKQINLLCRDLISTFDSDYSKHILGTDYTNLLALIDKHGTKKA